MGLWPHYEAAICILPIFITNTLFVFICCSVVTVQWNLFLLFTYIVYIGAQNHLFRACWNALQPMADTMRHAGLLTHRQLVIRSTFKYHASCVGLEQVSVTLQVKHINSNICSWLIFSSSGWFLYNPLDGVKYAMVTLSINDSLLANCNRIAILKRWLFTNNFWQICVRKSPEFGLNEGWYCVTYSQCRSQPN